MKSSIATSSAVAPSMFLSSARLASCSWLSSGDITTSSRSPLPFHGRELEANLLVEQQQQQQRHERQRQRRSQGILGFAIQSDLELSVPPALRATSSRAALSSLSLHATRPSNVDSTQWNLPRSFNSPWMTSASGIWKTTSSPVAWFPWIPTQQQILALKVPELKQACAERGLSRAGRKADLQTRLQVWTKQQLGQRQRLQEEGRSVGFSAELFAEPKAEVNESKKLPCIEQDDSSDSAADSLGEWARTVDLKPLLERREAIHREKRQGKTVAKPDSSTKTLTRDYISALAEVFEKPSSISTMSNNVEVLPYGIGVTVPVPASCCGIPSWSHKCIVAHAITNSLLS